MRIVIADFAGAAYPPGTKVSFIGWYAARHRARTTPPVCTDSNGKERCGNPYSLLTVVEPTHEPAMLLTEVATLNAINSRARSQKWTQNGLAVFRSRIMQIQGETDHALGHDCLKASKEEIVDTILHEIAHAIVGSKHGHDAVWKAVARRIGLPQRPAYTPTLVRTVRMWSAMGTTTLESTRKNIKCRRCKGNIEWKRVGINN